MKWFLVLMATCTGNVPPEWGPSSRDIQAFMQNCHDGRMYIINDKTQGPWATKRECEKQLAENSRWIGTDFNDVPPNFPLKNIHIGCALIGEQ